MPSLESILGLLMGLVIVFLLVRWVSRKSGEAPKRPGSRHGHPNSPPDDIQQLPVRDLEKLEALDKVEELQRKYDKDTDWKGRIPW